MRRVIQASTLVLLSLILVQCVDNTTQPVPVDPGEIVAINDTIMFRVGEKVTILPENLEVGFNRVVSDERCPYYYVCRYYQPAVVELWLKKPGMETIYVDAKIWMEIAIQDRQKIPLDTLDYRFSLIALFPYPINFDPIPQDQYLAYLEVETYVHRISQVDSVIITDLPPDSIDRDSFGLNYLDVNGDSLIVNMMHLGGCEEHSFQLYMSPAAFAESDPVQADLYLRHDSAGDECEKLFYRDLVFDLNPVARLYRDMYGTVDTIQVNVHHFGENRQMMESAMYFPGDLE